MSNVVRDERQRRQAADGGDPADLVWIPAGCSSSNRGYHDDQDCRQLSRARGTREETRGEAKAAGRYPCSRCVLGDGEPGGSSDGPSLAQALRRDEITTVAEAKQYVDERGGA